MKPMPELPPLLEKAKTKLAERKEALRQLDLRRRTPGTRENNLKQREYEAELRDANAGIDSAQKSVTAKEKSLDREQRPVSEAEQKLRKVNDHLFELAKLDKGLSEGDAQAKGNFAEAMAKEYMADKGFDKVGGHVKPQGIDGIFRKEGPPLENIIAEVKYVNDAKKYRNDPERAMRELLDDTLDGKQLSETWTERRLDEALQNSNVTPEQIGIEKFTKVLLIYDAKTRKFLTPIIVP